MGYAIVLESALTATDIITNHDCSDDCEQRR
jgi:hypothetical protein